MRATMDDSKEKMGTAVGGVTEALGKNEEEIKTLSGKIDIYEETLKKYKLLTYKLTYSPVKEMKKYDKCKGMMRKCYTLKGRMHKASKGGSKYESKEGDKLKCEKVDMCTEIRAEQRKAELRFNT